MQKLGKEEQFATYGLGNCTAVAIQFEKIGDLDIRGAIIAHYMPFTTLRMNVENDIRVGSKDVLELEIVAKALIVSPGVEDPFSPTGHSPHPAEQERVEILTRALKSIFGEQLKVSKVGYKPSRNHGWITDFPEPKERGTVMIEYPKEGGNSRLTVDGIDLNLPLP